MAIPIANSEGKKSPSITSQFAYTRQGRKVCRISNRNTESSIKDNSTAQVKCAGIAGSVGQMKFASPLFVCIGSTPMAGFGLLSVSVGCLSHSLDEMGYTAEGLRLSLRSSVISFQVQKKLFSIEIQ